MCVTTYHWGQTINHYIWDEKVFEPHNRRALRQTTGPNCGRVILRCKCRFFHMEHEILMVLQIFDMNKFEYLNIVILQVPFAANFCCAVTPTFFDYLSLHFSNSSRRLRLLPTVSLLLKLETKRKEKTDRKTKRTKRPPPGHHSCFTSRQRTT